MPTNYNLSGNALTDGVLWGSRWDFTNLKYAIASASDINTTTYAGYFGFEGTFSFNSAQVAAIHRAINDIEGVCNLTFTFDANVANGNIRYGRVHKLDYKGNDMHFPGGGGSGEGIVPNNEFPSYAQGDTWYYDDMPGYVNPIRGSFGYAAGFLHETLHALGLKHGHIQQTDQTSGIPFPALPTDFDSQEFSVMTYRRYVGENLANQVPQQMWVTEYSSTMMMADIAALQYMYGANFAHNSANTVYRWSPTTGEMFINNVGQGVPYHNKVLLTIWDGGGTDTYDMSAYTTPVNIDLAPGSFSKTSNAQLADFDSTAAVHLARANVFNAMLFNGDLRSRIENANGGSGNDIIKGNTGDNVLNGGGGADTMTGLTGNDTFIVDNAGDKTIEVGSSGVDTVRTSVSYGLASTANVENLQTVGGTSSTAVINLTGNAMVNALVGNAAANVLNGGGGVDTMSGAAGNDTYFVDNAADTIIEVAGQGTDNVRTSVSYTLGTSVSVEVLQTTSASGATAINLTGNTIVNNLIGNAAGNLLDGKAGADTMQGMAGNDSYIVDNAGDKIVETSGTDTLVTSVSYVLGAGVQVETMKTNNSNATTAINLTGNERVNLIFGNAAGNTINGGAGVDDMRGLAGNDTYIVDNSSDKIVETAGGGTDNIRAAKTYGLAAGVGVEVMQTIGGTSSTTAINLVGNEFGNNLIGNAAANILSGGNGNDLLQGFAGNDTLVGGANNDIFKFNTALNASTNVDKINDFVAVNDTIQLENAIFTGLANGALAPGAFNTGAAATQADDRIVYNTATGDLIFDVNGSGAGGGVKFATLVTKPAISAADFVVV
jgi:serralysin